MRVADKFGKSKTVLNLPPTALYAHASAEPDIRAEIERRIAAGEIVSADSRARAGSGVCHAARRVLRFE